MLRLFQFAVLTLGLALVALASAIVTMRFAIHGAEVTVPSFTGLTVQQALNKAADLGVELTVDNRLYSTEVPAGRILTQSPAPGTVVRREWHVRAAESLGPQLVAIPNLVGQNQRGATMQIRRLGLELGATAAMPFSGGAAGIVIAQDPLAGAAGVERPGIAILLGDSTPPPVATYVMPDFTGRPYATAASTLNHAGLKLAPPEIGSSDRPLTEGQTQPTPGTVIAQTPLAGFSIDANTPIQLTMAR